jgi:hypothetical protein
VQRGAIIKADIKFWYAHQGCFLNLPDDRYNSDLKPYVDLELIDKEAVLLRQEIAGAAGMGFAGFVHLMPTVDDFVSYEFLNHPDKARQLVKAVHLGGRIAELVAYAHSLGMEYHVQTYELLLDRHVARQIKNGISRRDLDNIIASRLAEFFSRTGADGLVVTPTEAHPRGNCEYVNWNDYYASSAEFANTLESICAGLGKKLRFRLWMLVETDDQWNKFSGGISPEVVLCSKNTASDFWLHCGINPAIACSGSSKLSVIFDAFGQYHGWGRLLYFDPDWPGHVKICMQKNTMEVQAWGSWSPSCIWPNEEPGFLCSGHMFNAGLYYANGLWQPEHLPGRLALQYLICLFKHQGDRIASVVDAAAQCGLGSDAEALAESLPLVEQLWSESYIPDAKVGWPLLDKWAMIFQYPRRSWRDFIRSQGRQVVRESNAKMRGYVGRLQIASRRISNVELAAAFDKTALYFDTLVTVREGACADASFAGEDQNSYESFKTDRLKICDSMLRILEQWRKFPEEATMWCITEFDERLSSRPAWLRAGSLRDYEQQLRRGTVRTIPEGPALNWPIWKR